MGNIFSHNLRCLMFSVLDETINFQAVLCHELGHSLGLDDSKDEESVMFYRIPNRTSLTKLSPDDVAGIRSLYGPPINPVSNFSQLESVDKLTNYTNLHMFSCLMFSLICKLWLYRNCHLK